MRLLRFTAVVFAIVVMAVEGYRSWGVGRPVAFWIDDMLMGAMLLVGAYLTGNETPTRRAFFGAAWGVAAGMFYGSFFGKLFAPECQSLGNVSLGALTVLTGVGLVVAVAGLIGSVALPWHAGS